MKVYIPVTIEEYEGDKFVELTAVVEVHPGEDAVRYYPDGSGYPGSPPEAELVGLHVDLAEDVDCEPVEVDIDDLYDYLLDNEDLWIERAFDEAS
jgi:hypothetical protein